MKRIALVTLTGMILTGIPSYAQDFLGYRQSNHAGVAAGDNNPAEWADSPYRVDVTLAAGSFNMYNNYVYMNTKNMPYWWTQAFKSGDPAVDAWQSDPKYGDIISADSAAYYQGLNPSQGNFFEFDNPKRKPRNSFMSTEIDVLNFLVSFKDNTMSVTGGLKVRSMLNVDHFSSDLITLINNNLDYTDLHGLDLKDELVNISFNAWAEYNAGFAMVLYDGEEHFLKGGIKLKFLQGMGSMYLYTKDVDYNFLNGDTLASISGNFNYGYSANIDSWLEGSPPTKLGDVYNLESKLGFGGDIGFVYEFRPKWKDYKYDMDGKTNIWRHDHNKYLLKCGIAINDLGGMNYAKSPYSHNFSANVVATTPTQMLSLFQFSDDTEQGWVTSAGDTLSFLGSLSANLDTLVDNDQGTYTDDDKRKYYMTLPTHMNFFVDYHIWKDFYVDLNLQLGFQMNGVQAKVRYPTLIALTPRYDFAWAGVSVPISYSKMSGFKVGACLLAGPMVIGTGDLKWIFAPGKDWKVRGVNLYAGLNCPIPYHHPKDKDLDKVSDKLDECVEVPGVWTFKGCPDTDADGIQDSEDACPTEPGPAVFQGCPDRDGDNIIDIKDDCPDDSGLVEFNGCPDRDHDNIIDKNDECPDEAGIEVFKGCPDRDGDGLKDSDDLCPDHPGPLVNQGCPDTDNDGIFDYLDGCPEVPGPEENKGCPWPDTDGDGVLDKDDGCPYNAGPKENNGCPYTDTDGDGVLDKDDDCVNVPGPVENKGCPKIEEEVAEILQMAFDNLEFETAKAIILQHSYESLGALADVLVKKPTWKLKISGHTDNQGGEQANMILSKKRSEAVRAFLESRGVDPSRCVVMWFGETVPIATNDTDEGRQKNRRVEMEIIFE